MRALVMLVVCFLLLAALQAGYLIVEARRSHHQLQIVDSADTETYNHGNEHAQWQPANGQHTENYKDVKKFTAAKKPGENEVTAKIHLDQFVIRPKTEGDDGKIHDKNYHNRKHKHDGVVPKSNQQVITNGSNSVHTHLRISLHGTISGNNSDSVPEYHQGIETFVLNTGTVDKHQARHQANSYNRKKLHKKGKHKCSSDTDCDTDKCCVERWNGRAVCRRSDKGLNRKCSSDCMCMKGLVCRFKTKPNTHKNGRYMGRCVLSPQEIEQPSEKFTFNHLEDDKSNLSLIASTGTPQDSLNVTVQP